ncbi:MAG: hypothetical protein AB7W59_00370 [Acidimicrobiia bacterium]
MDDDKRRKIEQLRDAVTESSRTQAELREFIALVAREVACQQLYDKRVYFDDLAPVKSVGLRSILPGEVSRVAEDFWRDKRAMAQSYLRAATRADTDVLKALGASMLAAIVRNRREG